MQVVDAGGNPVVGAAVTWVVTGGGGTLDPSTGPTDANGQASTTWTLGPTPGPNTAQAIVSGVGQAEFTATATAGTPSQIRIVSGDDQSGKRAPRWRRRWWCRCSTTPTSRSARPPSTWTVQAGGGSVAPTSAQTDADGNASTSWTLGPSTGAPAGPGRRLRARARCGSRRPRPPARRRSWRSGRQPSPTAQVGVPFDRQPVIQVRDAAGNPVQVAGVTITAAIASGSGTIGGTTTATTGPNGRATFTNLEINGATGAHTLIFAASRSARR